VIEHREPRVTTVRNWKIYVVLFSIGAALLIWAAECVKQTTEAETNLHSALIVVDMIYEYVESRHGWPASWADLEPMRQELVRQHNPWAKDMRQLMQRVDVDFDAKNDLPSNDTWLVRPPIRPHIPYYPAPFNTRMGSLIQSVNQCRGAMGVGTSEE
jgi:hypothetical protein